MTKIPYFDAGEKDKKKETENNWPKVTDNQLLLTVIDIDWTLQISFGICLLNIFET